MAGKRQEDSLTIEDKLKAALVPDDEQPYPLPGNWVWTRVGKLALLITKGSTPTSYGFSYKNEGIRFIKTENIDEYGRITPNTDFIDEATNAFLKRSILHDKDILFSIAGTIGRVGIIEKEMLPANTNQALAIIRCNWNYFNNKHLFYYLKSEATQRQSTASIVGVGRANVSLRDIGELIMPLPPLPEQQRIAEKLESLLGKIKEAKALLDEIPEILQNFRQTVLAAACSGRLTEDWRKANPKVESTAELLKRIALESKMHQIKNPPYVAQDIANKMTLANLPDTWAFVELGEICELVPNRNPGKEKDVLFKYIDISSISNLSNTVIEMKEFYGSHAPSRARRSIQKDDILFSTVRTYLKNIAMVTQDEDNMLCSTGFCVIRPFKGLQSNYFFYLVLGDAFINNVTLTQTGTSYPATSDKKIFSEMIALPPLSEQEEIVRRVESLFSKADDLEAQYKEAVELIESLPEIILSKAFRGELVPQDPNDEPAFGLLERITFEKEKHETEKVEGTKRKKHRQNV